MQVYHYHPNHRINLRTDAVHYQETPDNFLLDYGHAAIVPVNPYNEIYYDLDDLERRANIINGESSQFFPIETPDVDIEAIINAIPSIIAAKEARTFVLPPTFNEIKNEKISELGRQTVARCNAIIGDGVTSFGHLRLIRAQYLSVDVNSRTPTVEFQDMIDTFQAGEVAAEVITLLTTEAEVVAYNVVTDPVWP